jgi:chloride channel 3/4/5
MIYLNGYPFLDSKEDHTFGVPVSQCMSSHVVTLAATGMQLKHIERLMTENQYQGYPIVETFESKTLVGYIGRTELRYAVEKAKTDGAPGHAKCHFTTTTPLDTTSAPLTTFDTIPATSSTTNVNLSRYIDDTPLTVHPRLPLETVMELFKKMGPRVILIEYRGRLTGLVTVKDCLKYQFKVEAGHAGGGSAGDEAGMQRVFEGLKKVVGWGGALRGKMGLGRGEVRLASPDADGRGTTGRRNDNERSGAFAVGDDEDEGGTGVELEDRRGGR